MLISRILDRFRRSAEAEIVMEDELLGRLTWDEVYRGWRGVMAVAGGKAATFVIDGVKTDESVPEAARKIARFMLANEPSVRHRIAVSMSEIYNGPWSGGGDTITPEALAQRIALTGVYVDEEGGGELHYKAEDGLFTDHTICASIDVDGEIGEPDLEG